jgi:acyl-CoA thioesterase
MTLASLLAQLEPAADRHIITIPATWYQGRTAYGGLSTALAYQSAKLMAPDLPPLLSAQIAFSGPVAGAIEIQSTVLRRGRNSAFVRSDIRVGDDIALSATFIFMARRDSRVAFDGFPAPSLPPLPAEDQVRSGPEQFFTHNMEYSEGRAGLLNGDTRIGAWHRFKERESLDPIAELLCIGDALPPAAMGLMPEKAPVSSINWQVNILESEPRTNRGWWYVQSEADHAIHGSSSQRMMAWNSEGRPMMTGMQAVALFI